MPNIKKKGGHRNYIYGIGSSLGLEKDNARLWRCWELPLLPTTQAHLGYSNSLGSSLIGTIGFLQL